MREIFCLLVKGLVAFKLSGESADGKFQLDFNNNSPLAKYLLKNEDVFLISEGVKLSASNGGLIPNGNMIKTSGSDKLGSYEMFTNMWQYQVSNKSDLAEFATVTKLYNGQDLAIFEQHFFDEVDVAPDTFIEKGTACSGFPVFDVNNENDDIGFTTPGGNVMGWTKMAAGKYKLDDLRVAPLDGRFVADRNGAITILYGGDSFGKEALVMSPFNNFMALHNVLDMENGHLYFGVQGGVKKIPAGFVASTIVQGSNLGTRKAIDAWGDNLRTWYDRTSAFRDSDLFITHMGYNTNAGAYYYYNREGDMNYEDTMAFASNYFEEKGIPIRWMQYDSWFYKKGKGAGVKDWIPRTDKDYFPSGAQEAYLKHGRQLQCHNRWWAPDNVYAKQNGGEYDFIIEPDGVKIEGPIEIEIEGPNGRPINIEIIGESGYSKGPFSLPNDDRFWMDFFEGVKTWGMESYLQDWMMDTYLFMNATQETVDVARNWLVNMGSAADAHDINIQYCLTLTKCGLQALEIPRVTMARASADYTWNFAQWTIGLTGLITDKLGMAPHKDTFYTVRRMPDNNNVVPENYPDLHSAVATLSTGPVAFGDKPGTEDMGLFMQCCRADGKILKPSRAISAIDAQIRGMGADIEHTTGPAKGFNGTIIGNRWNSQGQVWTTYSKISGFEFGVIFNAMLLEDFHIGFEETEFETDEKEVFTFKAYPEIEMIGENAFPLKLSSDEKFGLHYTSPIFKVGDYNIALAGESEKWTKMSPQRVSKIMNYGRFMLIELDGVPREKINFIALAWVDGQQKKLLSQNITFGSSLKATIRIENGRISADTL